MTVSLELLLTEPAGFDLDASPLQRAITRAADGKQIGDDLDDAAVQRHFGCERSAIGLALPVLVVTVAGVRSGKSLLAGCAAVKGVLTADLSKLRRHEVPRFAIVAPNVDNASATFRLLVGSVMESTTLRKLVVGEPTADTLVLRRPSDGRQVEIVVVAASRGAVTLRSRWLVGFVLDECALFGSEPTGAAVNAEELLRAAETRLVPGAQGWLVSSPFGPQGLLFDLYKAHFGDPGRVLVVHAPTTAMNPAFPQAQVEAIRARDPDVAAREYEAAFIDTDTAMFDAAAIDRATRVEPLVMQPEPGVTYACVIDAATRSNGWGCAVAGMRQTPSGLRRSVVYAREWRGSKVAPLSPRQVFAEMAVDVKPYGIDVVFADQWSADALRELAQDVGLTLSIEPATQQSKHEMYSSLDALLKIDGVDLPPHPLVRQDLLGVRRRVGRNGVSIELVRTGDGRHADLAPAVAGAIAKAYVPPASLNERPRTGSPEWEAAERERRRREHFEEGNESWRRHAGLGRDPRSRPGHQWSRAMQDTKRRWGIPS